MSCRTWQQEARRDLARLVALCFVLFPLACWACGVWPGWPDVLACSALAGSASFCVLAFLR